MCLVLCTTSTIKLFSNIKKSARLLSGAFLSLLLCACASTPQTHSLLTNIPENLSTQTELRAVPFFPQEAYQCGPAALATLLVDKNKTVTPEELISKVYLPERKGSLQIEMVATARSYGLLTYQLKPQLEDVLQEVDAGRPVLVFQNLAYNWAPQWHYAVVVGFDLLKQQLILRSGTHKRHLISLDTFERTWQRGNYWAYVLLQPDEVAQTATPLKHTKAATELMRSGHPQAALQAYEQATRQWPDETLTFMALGNAHYASHHFPQAIQAFEQAIKLKPDNAQAWNNLAYAYAANQCNAASIKAISCAVKQAPDDKNLQDSLNELTEKNTSSAQQCAIPSCPR